MAHFLCYFFCIKLISKLANPLVEQTERRERQRHSIEYVTPIFFICEVTRDRWIHDW